MINLTEILNEAIGMSQSDRNKIYHKLNKGDKVRIKFGNAIRKGNEGEFIVSKGKTKVGKQRVERITLKNVKNPSGVKYYLYNRNNNIGMAQGDMGAVIEDMKIVKESVNENISQKTIKHNTRKGTLHIEIEEDTAGVMVDVIFNRVDLSTTDIQFPTGDVEITKRKKKVKLKESVNERYRPNLESKGWEAAQKEIQRLQRSVFPKLDDDELLEFRKAIADAFNLNGILK